MISEEEKRNIQRLKEAMREVAQETSYEVWRIVDIVLDAHKIGGGSGSEEYRKQLDILINPNP